MRGIPLLCLLLCLPVAGAAPDPLADAINAGQQWLEDNIDPAALEQFGQMDADQLKALCLQLQQQLQTDDVIDLAALRRQAASLLAALEQCEETRPYAAWLKSRLDYLEAAETLRQSAPTAATNSPPALERSTWQQLLRDRPLPAPAELMVPQLKRVFAAQHVPPALVWLAEVESAFNPAAQSPVGAAGLFQLMPATATANGLKLRPEDERLNPQKSALAAAHYLRYLYGQFKDWRLAIAAYNAGEGRVRRLLASRDAVTFDQIAAALPAETQMYVPKVEATVLRREGITLADLPGPPTKLD
jgi:membrane-bound lytic murein transglycosylase D